MIRPARAWKLKCGHIYARSKVDGAAGKSIRIEVTCPDCKNNFWPWLSNVYNSKGWKCRKCSSKKYRRPHQLKPEKDVISNIFLNMYRQAAKRRKLVFDLTKNKFSALVRSNCHYCGAPPVMRTRKVNKRSVRAHLSGIDRVNNATGYTDQNTVSCCSRCNEWKSKLTQNEFIAHAVAIAKNQPIPE